MSSNANEKKYLRCITNSTSYNSIGEKKNFTSDEESTFISHSSSSEDIQDQYEEAQFHYDENRDLDNIPITKNLYLYTFCAAMNSCNLGYDIGVNTGAAKLIEKSMNLSNSQLEIFMGSLNLFAMIGALTAQFISDTMGRLKAFQLSCLTFIFGLLVMLSSDDFKLLLLGRTFVGLGVGFGLALDPVYIAEIAPSETRGYLVTWSEFALGFGILLGFSSSLIFEELQDGMAWRCMFGAGAIMPTMLIILVWKIMPESPRWLISKGKYEEAANVLSKTYPLGYPIKDLVKEIKEAHIRDTKHDTNGWDVILNPTPASFRMLVVGIGAAVAQTAVGIEAIQYYLVFIIEEAGVKNRTFQSLILIFLGLLKLTFTQIAGSLFDRKGRKPLMYLSFAGMAFALIIQAFNFMAVKSSSFLAISCLAMYELFFSIGAGPGCWLIPSEVFATSIRAKAMSLATFSNRLVGTITASTFLSIANSLSWAGYFFLLAFMNIAMIVFFYILVPETKGQSLEDMTIYFTTMTNDKKVLNIEKINMQEHTKNSHSSEVVFEVLDQNSEAMNI